MRTISGFRKQQKAGCNRECTFGQECLRYIDFEVSFNLIELFWGTEDDEVKLPKERRQSISTIFDVCNSGFDSNGRLNFQIIDKAGKPRRICEAALLFILGYIDTPNASDANPQWLMFKRMKLNESRGVKEDVPLRKAWVASQKGIQKSQKHMDAKGFINGLLLDYFGETIPTKEGATEDGEVKEVKILPYETVDQLYEEYTFEHDIQSRPQNTLAKISLFRKVLSSLSKYVKLLRCKGSFPTCDICNTALEMLRDTKRWNKAQRDIVLKFRRLHLKQQQLEREHLEQLKDRSRKLDSKTGMPLQAFFFTDAMTSSKGNTPKEGVKRKGKEGKTVLNRVFGTQVICGPIEFMMYTSVNQLQMGGANLAIEVQRLAIEKLSFELEKHNLLMPRIMNFQFDNCGENKVSSIRF